MKVHLLSIGTELSTGQVIDTNAAWLSARLSERGIRVVGHTTLPDDTDIIRDALARVSADHDMVVITGGLGPTEDDLTRFALAGTMGVDLVTDPDLLADIRRFFSVRNRPMPTANEVQARIPEGARPLLNPCGTAPGIHARIQEAEVFSLPGVPREMRRMFEDMVLPHVAAATGTEATVSTMVHTFGSTESEIGEKVRDLMARGRNPDVGTTAGGGLISIRIRARGDTPEAARALLDKDVAEVESRLSRYAFGRDHETLAVVVARLLTRRRSTLSTAESCTGGLVAKYLTDVPGSSAYLIQGVVSYSNAAKTRLLAVAPEMIETHGAVSPEVAEAMAVGSRTSSNTDFALSLTGIAGPTGGTDLKPIGLVYIGLAQAEGCTVKEIRCGRHQARNEIRERAANAALNLLRLELLESGDRVVGSPTA